jgi:ketosteroid isomerase-like protein
MTPAGAGAPVQSYRRNLSLGPGWYDIDIMTPRVAFKSALGLLICLTIRLAAQEPAGAAAQVGSLEEKWTEAYKQRQIDILSTLLAEDFVITVEDGNTYSKAGYITHSADPSVHVEVAELSDLRVRVRGGGNIAVVTGAYHEVGRSNGKPYEYHDRLTDVWVRVGNSWRVTASHYSVPLKQ